MKTSLQQFFILLGIIVSPHTFGQTRTVDQANEIFYPPSLENVEYFYPMGQEFRPALTCLNFVELMLWDFYGHGYVTGELAVSIHAGTITGPVLGTRSSLFLPPTFQGVGHFDFDTSMSLTPGGIYVIQVDVLSGGDWGVGASGTSSYAGGRKIRSGIPVENDDLFFREGISVVPEPSTMACLGLGLALLPLVRNWRSISSRGRTKTASGNGAMAILFALGHLWRSASEQCYSASRK